MEVVHALAGHGGGDGAGRRAAATDDGVTGLAAARPARAVVSPGGLHGEAAGREGKVERAAAGTRGDPGALVPVLILRDVGPSTGRVLVGDRLGLLMPVDDRETVQGAARVDEILSARRTRVRYVPQGGERDLTVGGRRRATGERGVPVLVMPGAELPGRAVEAVR